MKTHGSKITAKALDRMGLGEKRQTLDDLLKKYTEFTHGDLYLDMISSHLLLEATENRKECDKLIKTFNGENNLVSEAIDRAYQRRDDLIFDELNKVEAMLVEHYGSN